MEKGLLKQISYTDADYGWVRPFSESKNLCSPTHWNFWHSPVTSEKTWIIWGILREAEEILNVRARKTLYFFKTHFQRVYKWSWLMIVQHAVFGFTMERKPYTFSGNRILGFEFDLAWAGAGWYGPLSLTSQGEQPIHLQPPWNHTAILPLSVKRSKH